MNFKANESSQKLRGGYYTPLDLATFMARWVKEKNAFSILEPSCGDGVFFEALAKLNRGAPLKILGFELDSREATKASRKASNFGLSTSIEVGDFLNWALRNFDGRKAFDAVLGNPPFVRYQYLPKAFQSRAEQVFKRFDLPFTKHTNAWVPFVIASLALLKPGGRLAMIVPSEIIHVTHAQSLRSYLGRECSRMVIIDPEELWFRDTLQGAVILLAEKRQSKAQTMEGLGIYPVKDREFLHLDAASVFNAPRCINGKTVEGKWTRALLDSETRNLFDELAEHESIHRFGDIASVDVGIVTGANKFFLVADETVETFGLQKWAHPMFGRSEHCPGIIYDHKQHEENSKKGTPTNFLWFNESANKLGNAEKQYIKEGERQKLNERYKCKVRSPWYTVPSVYSTEIGMLKRSHNTPRLILNKIGAYTTDTAYRIRSSYTAAEKLVGCFVNPLTALSAELEGRHYGGGVLELIPSEIERLLIPLPDKVRIDLAKMDRAIRTLHTHQVLDRQGKQVLGAIGLGRAKMDCIMEGWRKLRNRRHRNSSDREFD